jgi:hypothetical protein
VRFSPEFHRPIVAVGPGRNPQAPIWHVDSLIRTFEQRLEKARRYEQTRPGMRIAGRALNFAFYTPELRPGAPLASLPPHERAHVESVLHAERPHGPARAVVETATRERIDAAWPDAGADIHSGALELLERPAVLTAGEQRTIDVLVSNKGGATWEWGSDAVAEIRVGSRWYDDCGCEVDGTERRAALGAPIPPLASDVVPVPIQAADEPGRYRVEIDLVHEHVRRFALGVGFDVVVVPAERVVVFGSEAVPRLLELAPEIDPIVLRPSPASRPDAYPEAPDLHAYLLDGLPQRRAGLLAGAFWRSARLAAAARGVGPALPRGGDDFLTAVRRSRLLVVHDLEAPHHRRELWRVVIALGAAKAVGVRTAVHRGALGDGALARAAERRASLVYDHPSELLAQLGR